MLTPMQLYLSAGLVFYTLLCQFGLDEMSALSLWYEERRKYQRTGKLSKKYS
jgi:hypothetical protein